jgi:hypothetical protein
MTPTMAEGLSETSLPFDTGRLLLRARSEFLEMAGLILTKSQAARLWALDRATSDRLLEMLAATGFLFRNHQGAYLRTS